MKPTNSMSPEEAFEHNVEATLAQIVAGHRTISTTSWEVVGEARKRFLQGVDKRRTEMHTGSQVKVSYREEVKQKMATLKPITPEELGVESHAGVKYASLVGEFVDSGMDMAEVDGEGVSGATLNVALRNYLSGRDLPVAVRSKSTPTGETRTTKKGDEVAVHNVQVFLIRTDTETGARYAPKPRKPRSNKASENGQAEAPQANLEEDPFESLDAEVAAAANG